MKKFILSLLLLTTFVVLAQNTIVEQATEILIRNSVTNAVGLRIIKPTNNVAPFLEFGSQQGAVFSVSSSGVVTGNGSGLTGITGAPLTNTILYGNAQVQSNLAVQSLAVTNDATVGGNLDVTGTITATGVSVGAGIINAETLTSDITLNINGELRSQAYLKTETTAVNTFMNFVDATAGDIVLTLPVSLNNPNRTAFYRFVRIDTTTNSVSVDVAGGALINGYTNMTLLPWQAVELVERGTNYVNDSDALGSAIRTGPSGITNSYQTTIQSGISTNGSGFKHGRVTTGSINATASALVTNVWGTSFADTNYTAFASVEDSTTATNSLYVVHIEAKRTNEIVVRVANGSGGALTGVLNVLGIHD